MLQHLEEMPRQCHNSRNLQREAPVIDLRRQSTAVFQHDAGAFGKAMQAREQLRASARPAQRLDAGASGCERVERNINAIEVAVVLLAVLQVVDDLQNGAHVIRRRPNRAALAMHVEHETTDRHGRIAAIVDQIVPKFQNIGLVIPVPASKPRQRQPVYEVAQSVAKKIAVNSFEGIVAKAAPDVACPALKDLGSKAEKVAALEGRFSLKDTINGEGKWNALVIDDLFDTGASMEAVCATLRTFPKINKLFVATLTWK